MQIHITLDREDFTRSMNGPDAVAEALALLATAVHGRLPMEELEPNLGTREQGADPVSTVVYRAFTTPVGNAPVTPTAEQQTTETPAPKKRGRKSLAEKAAEREPAMSEPEPEPEQETEAEAATDDNQPELPFEAPAETVQEVTPDVPAMPEEAAVVETEEMTLEDLKSVTLAVNQKRPGASFPVLRRSTWADGSEKPSWLTAEAVPPEMRARLAAEMKASVGLE